MRLHETLTDSGGVFFRWRSYTPLLLIPFLFLERHALQGGSWEYHRDGYYEAACVAVVLFGLLIRAMTIGHVAQGTSGRNTVRQVATDLNETGAYSIVRNPLYVGNYFILLGLTLMARSWELAVINSFFFALAYLPIILTEEDFLTGQFGERYVAYAARVPCFVPNPRLWRPAELPFSMRMLLRREHDTWMTAATGLVALALYRDYLQMGSARFDHGWIIAGFTALVTWLIFKVLKLWTGLLPERVKPTLEQER